MGGKVQNIAIFTGIFHPESGGPATYLYNLANSLTDKGYQIKILTFGEKNNKIYRYQVKRISRKWPIFIRFFIYFVNVFKQSKGADLLFVSDYGFPVAIANFLMRKKTIIKIVGDFAWEKSVRDGLTKDGIDNFQKKRQCFRAGILKRIQRFYVSRMDQVITPSNYLKKIISGWGIEKKKIKVIYNAIDVSLTPSPSPSLERGKRKSGKVLVTVARLVPWKGIDKTITVLSELKNEFKNIEYWVIGDGPDQKRLKKLAEECDVEKNVKFLGKIAHEKVLGYLQKADLFVLYSGYEGLPHVILEAMAVGLPSVVSNIGGNPEVIKIGKCGVVCEKDSDLASTIQKSLSKPITVKAIPEKFIWDNLVSEVERVISG